MGKGWRTLAVNLGVAVVGVLAAFNWADAIPNNPQIVGAIVAVIGGVNMVLRYFTTTPVGTK